MQQDESDTHDSAHPESASPLVVALPLGVMVLTVLVWLLVLQDSAL